MGKLLQLFILSVLLFLVDTSRAQTAFINAPFTDTLQCAGDTTGGKNRPGTSFTVDVGTTGTFNAANFFKIELSNATGSFANPTVIGYRYDFQGGTANCQVPVGIAPGTGYRMRVVSTDPVYTSSAFPQTIRISKYPDVKAGGKATLCVGETITLTATTASTAPSFAWTGPLNFASNQQNPSIINSTENQKGTYRVTVTSYKCSSEDTFDVNILPAPDVNTFDPDINDTLCEDGDLNISLQCNVCTNAQFRWYIPGNPNPISQSGITFKNVPQSAQGYYKVEVSVGSCKATDSFYVTVKPLPDTPNVTSNSPLCVGDTLQLDGSSTTGGVAYEWEGPGGFTSNTAKSLIYGITKAQEGNYKLYAVKDGCRSKPGVAKVEVGIPLVPLPVSGDTLLCPGDKLQLSAQTTATAGIEWRKTGSSIIQSQNRTLGKNPVTAADAGTYYVTQEVLGCKSPPSYITVLIPDLKAPDPKNNGPLCIGENLELSMTPSVNGSNTWTGPNGFSSTSPEPEIKAVDEKAGGEYIVVTVLDHCADTASTKVVIKPMPEVKNISSNSPVCDNAELKLSAESTVPNSTFDWTGPNGFTSKDQYPSVFFKNNASGLYYVKAIADGCISAAKSTQVETKEGPGKTTVSNNGPLQEGDDLELYAKNDKEGVTFYWEGPDNFTSDEQNPRLNSVTYKNNGAYKVTSVYNGCSATVQTVVDIKDILGLAIELYPNPNNGKFTVEGIVPNDNPVNMTIFNHQGMLMLQKEIYPDKAKFTTDIDMTGSASGVYLMQLRSGAEKKIIRFTIVRQ